MLTYWPQLVVFTAAVLCVVLYGLTASGHFPPEFRDASLRDRDGAIVLWGSMAVATAAGVTALVAAGQDLPWYAVVITAGATLLFAPLLLRPFPDAFVNGRAGLLVFSGLAALLAAVQAIVF